MSQKSGLMRGKRGVIVVGPVGMKRPDAPDISLSNSVAKE
jgi:hypothetical protein